MVCLGNICINTLHKGAKDDDDDDDDDNFCYLLCLLPFTSCIFLFSDFVTLFSPTFFSSPSLFQPPIIPCA
jgi:hypothetical protein